MPGNQHHHRAGGLRQSNKKNKRSKASKRSLARAAGGKILGGARHAASAMAAQSKADRRNMQQQKRQAKKQEMLRKRRGMIGSAGCSCNDHQTPRLVGIISLGENQDLEDRLRSLLVQTADRVETPHQKSKEATVTVQFDVHKKDGVLTLLTGKSSFSHYGDGVRNESAPVMAALDLARVCDLLVIVVDGNGPRDDDDDDEKKIMDMQIGGGSDDRSTATGKTGSTSVGQNWDHLISERGDRILSAIKSQGLPTVLTVLAHTEKDILEQQEDHMTMQSVKSLRRSSVKRRLGLKKYVSRFATTEFGNANDRVVEIDMSSMDDDDDEGMGSGVTGGGCSTSTSPGTGATALARTLCTMACSPPKWVAESPRTYLVSDNYQYDSGSKELQISGFLRGMAPFDVNALIHVPNLGTVACKSVKRSLPPMTKKHKRESSAMDSSVEELVLGDPEERESLEMFASPDALAGEQNLIGFDDEDIADANDDEQPVARPAGWSDYQSAWLDAVDEVGLDGTDKDHGELAAALNRKDPKSSTTDADMDMADANDVTAEERKSLLAQRLKEQSEHQEFPDEVEVGEDEKASERFARYRSLKSFRKSFWDPKENLPDSYGSVYHFSSFKGTQRSVMNDMKALVREAERCDGRFFGKTPKSEPDVKMADNDDDDDFDILEGCIPTGSYVTVTLDIADEESVNCFSPDALLTAVSLLSHENKLSVLHVGLSQSPNLQLENAVPIKSRDVLTFRCGWRTWRARPVFSQQNLNCDKHKFERYLPTGGAYFAASLFGPVTYTPCPVMVFREAEQDEGSLMRTEMVATGTVLNADADRIVVKRIVLTGYPVRVHKRHATVKYMFYNPDDVKWFKPAGLYTKHGLQGNIIESVGEHGTMKCLFNAPVKQHDTVCLPLYKRIYPKFASLTNGAGAANDQQSIATSSGRKHSLIVR